MIRLKKYQLDCQSRDDLAMEHSQPGGTSHLRLSIPVLFLVLGPLTWGSGCILHFPDPVVESDGGADSKTWKDATTDVQDLQDSTQPDTSLPDGGLDAGLDAGLDGGDASTPLCGNGILDPGELCDDGDQNSDTAPDACRTDCMPARCGDQVVDTGETCDGTALAGHTCQELGFWGGTLLCAADCHSLDESQCTNCGDGLCDHAGGEGLASCPSDCGWTEVAIGEGHVCGILGEGSLWCWGANSSGQLGIGSTHTPVDPPAPPQLVSTFAQSGLKVAAVAAGGYHTCAITDRGTLYCWGANAEGQVGDGVGTSTHTLPQTVAGLPNGEPVQAVSCGGGHTCALVASSVWCWGYNRYGQIGQGSFDTDPHPTPVQVTFPNAHGVPISLAAGWNHTCALFDSGELWCWGAPMSGALGNASNSGDLGPVLATAAESFSILDVGAGEQDTFILTSSGNLWGWGNNNSHRLGDGQDHSEPNCTNCSYSAVQVAVGAPVARFSASARSSHGCAVTNQGQALCWGSNSYGQIGNATTTTAPVPSNVQGMSTAIVVAVGSYTSCAIDSQSQMWCWGRNNASGMLGDESGSHTNCGGDDCSLVPVQVHAPY